MLRKIMAFVTASLFVLALAGCMRVSDIQSIEFVQVPKTVYLIGETVEPFTIKVTDGRDEYIRSSDHESVVISGFDTTTVGSRTMTVTVTELEDASADFVYTVVSSLTDLLFEGGLGTVESPYEIANAAQLSNMRLALDSHFVLLNDIDLAGIVWEPIGEIEIQYVGPQSVTANIIEGFSGVLDGQGYSILNFTESLRANISIFSAIEGSSSQWAEIKNLTLNVNIDSPGSAKALADVIDYAIIENVTITGSIRAAGSIAGFNWTSWNAQFINCRNEADLHSTRSLQGESSINYVFMAGITMTVHPGESSTVTFDNCENTGDMTHDYSTELVTLAGQILAQAAGNGTIEVLNSTGSGTIIGNEGDYYGYQRLSETELSAEKDYVTTGRNTLNPLVGRKIGSSTLTFGD